MKEKLSKLLVVMMLGASAFLFTACFHKEKTPGEKLDEAVEEVKKAW